MSEDKEHSFEVAKKWHPEERKVECEWVMKHAPKLIGALEECIANADKNGADEQTVESWNQNLAKVQEIYENAVEMLEDLGGRTRERTHKVLNNYEPEVDSRWFVDGFDNFERKLFTSLMFGDPDRPKLIPLVKRFKEQGAPLNPGKLVVDDRGMGSGRTLRMLMDVVRAQSFMKIARKFAKNLHGIDIMPKNLQDAIKLFREGKYGFLTRNISVGDYLDGKKHRKDTFRHKRAHLITLMMHTLFYNTTMDEWIKTFTNIKADLLPKGLCVFDTVAMRHNTPEDLKKGEAFLDDLKDIYTRFWIQYCENNQRFMPEGIRLNEMERRHIDDNTTGKGFQVREVPDKKFIEYIIKRIGGGLRIVDERMRTPEINDQDAIVIGRKWIFENNFEEKYKNTIKERIEKRIVNPSQLLGRDVDLEKEPVENVIEELMDYVARYMVQQYQNHYFIIERI